MGVNLSGPSITATLANAHRQARTEGERLASSQLAQHWLPGVEALLEPPAPKTYIAVLTTIITARAMFDADVLDVRAIQKKHSDRGYAAASIAKQVSAFAKEHQIDLRATSSQPMNNQPFTFESYLDRAWQVNPRGASAWEHFNDLVDEVQNLSPADARTLLSILFHRCRRREASILDVTLHGGRGVYDSLLERVCTFVDTTPSNGRIGQAFAAALLDTVYDPFDVQVGALHDPDATLPGDVHVGKDATWLWAEVKQKVIETGDIEGFIDKVSNIGGDRVAYFALSNEEYGANLIRDKSIAKSAKNQGVHVTVVKSSREASDWVLSLARGPLTAIAETLLERLHARMLELGCTPEAISEVENIAQEY